MAHTSNFAIPARIVFRPYKASWFTCLAEIIGWWEEPKLEPISVFKSIAPIGNLSSSAFALTAKSGDKVLVNVYLPTEKIQPTSYLHEMLGIETATTYTIEINRADIPIEVLQPHENMQNTPDIAGRDFAVLACPMPEYEELFPSLKPEGPTKDAWKMQSEFFEMEQEIGALRGFLNRWGLWNWQRGYDAGGFAGPHPQGFALVIPHLVWAQRDVYKNAKAGKPRAWLGKTNYLSFSTIDEPPYFQVERSYCEQAIQATITIDHLSNVEFGICKREDCQKLFERTTKQKRLYCSPECAHLANVRKLRAAKKKVQSKRKGANQNAKRKN